MQYNPIVVNVTKTSVELHRTVTLQFPVLASKKLARNHYVSFVEYYIPAEQTMSTIGNDMDDSSPPLVRFGLRTTIKGQPVYGRTSYTRQVIRQFKWQTFPCTTITTNTPVATRNDDEDRQARLLTIRTLFHYEPLLRRREQRQRNESPDSLLLLTHASTRSIHQPILRS